MIKILLVEDNEANRDMLSRRLMKKGFELMLAKDGFEAVEMATSISPDLILMDISLPEIDGLEATRRIRMTEAGSDLPIIALTAHAQTTDRTEALEAGCNDFDTKPVEMKRLLLKINTLIGEQGKSGGDHGR